jgi:glucose-fructose oxidoreductase
MARKQMGAGKGQRGAARPRAKRESRKVGYAVVGLGHFAQEAVLPAFAHAESNSRLAALVTGDSEKARKLGRKYGVPVYGYEQLEECLARPEVDAVYIATPNAQHMEFAVRAARAGAHVLCEKPMAMSEAECRRMIGACEDSDVRLMVAYRLHFEEANLKLVEAIRKGRIGDPRIFTSTFSFQVNPPNIRLEKAAGGGVAWDIGVYCVNAARYLFQAEPLEVFAFRARGQDARFAETEEAVTAVMRFPDDRVANFTVSFGAASTATYLVVGTEGEVRLENAYDYHGELQWKVKPTKGRASEGTVPPRDHLAPELMYFSDCVLKGEQPEPDGWEGLADVRIISALYESAERGRSVRIEPVRKRARPTGKQEMRVPQQDFPKDLVNVEAPTQ